MADLHSAQLRDEGHTSQPEVSAGLGDCDELPLRAWLARLDNGPQRRLEMLVAQALVLSLACVDRVAACLGKRPARWPKVVGGGSFSPASLRQVYRLCS